MATVMAMAITSFECTAVAWLLNDVHDLMKSRLAKTRHLDIEKCQRILAPACLFATGVQHGRPGANKRH